MPKTPPGETRQRIFALVRQRLLAGDPPTLREIQKVFEFRAIQTVKEHLDTLVGEKRLVRSPGLARGYRLPRAAGEAPVLLVPLLGRVPAGPLALAVEEARGYLAVQSRLPASELFALAVRGDSMTGAGILAADLVIVRKQSRAQSG